MDDLKISHKDLTVVNEVTTSLGAEYCKVGDMTARRGKKHDYLETTLDFSEDCKCIVDMKEYLGEILSRLPENMNVVATTPAADHLFKMRDAVSKLNKERAELFHHITTQILFVAQRGRPDLWTAISFLTKQVGEDNIYKDDNNKLTRMAKYIRRTKFLCLTIKAAYLV